jgi:hypothetical protein
VSGIDVTPGAKAGAILRLFDHEEAAALARLTITPADTAGAATLAPAPVRASASAGVRSGARRTAWRWGLLLVAGWLVQAGLRAWLSRAQVAPLANPDETAYLIAARVLAGGPAANLSGSTLYQGGYPLLITPVYWFTSNPVTVYHAVLMINAVISAIVMPLGYLASRRLGLDRPAAYAVAMIAALVPAAFFYSEYALSDAIFPVLVLAWLLTVHSWLTASSRRGRYATAVGAALLTGFSYAVHSRGVVLLLGFAAVGALLAWRRPAARGSAAAAGLTVLLAVGAAWALNRYIAAAIYPDGTRSLSSQLLSNLASVRGVIHALEMAAGQLWRLVLDSWGIAGIGLIAAVAAIVRPGLRSDLRIMAGLSVATTVLIACIAPAALPANQGQTWASERYLDGMIVTFFIVGAAVLLRASTSRILAYAACVTGLTALTAVTVAVYAGTSLPLSGFGYAFNFGELGVLTQDWHTASVLEATAVALGLLALWVAAVLIVRRGRGVVLAGGLAATGLAVAAVSMIALVQMTSHVSQAGTVAQAADTTGFVTAGGLKPGERFAFASDLRWGLWIPQSVQISWMPPEFFNPASAPPAGVTVVEVPWPASGPASASWPQAPAGWRVVASNRAGSWVVWRDS